MAALTADRITLKKELGLKSFPIKTATKIFAGSIVAVDGNGFALPAADAANHKVVGVAKETIDNTGADGALSINVEADILAQFDATSITQAMVGKVMYVVDDHTFDDTLGTNGVKAGKLVEYVSTTKGWLFIKPTGPGCVVADADATYGQPEADLINNLKLLVNSLIH